MSVKDTDLLQGPIPEQWKPENQDPSVAYHVNHVTGETTTWDPEVLKAEIEAEAAAAPVEPAVELTDEERALLAQAADEELERLRAETLQSSTVSVAELIGDGVGDALPPIEPATGGEGGGDGLPPAPATASSDPDVPEPQEGEQS